MMSKKVYTKPELEICFIDNEISLVMMTDEGTPPGKGVNQEVVPTGPAQQNNFEENPFGN